LYGTSKRKRHKHKPCVNLYQLVRSITSYAMRNHRENTHTPNQPIS